MTYSGHNYSRVVRKYVNDISQNLNAGWKYQQHSLETLGQLEEFSKTMGAKEKGRTALLHSPDLTS